MTHPTSLTVAIAAVGLLVLVLGGLGLVRPASLIGLVERAWRSPRALYLAIGFRVALGVLLVAAAPGTRFPRVLGALGALSLVAAAAAPVLGLDRLRDLTRWWGARPPGFVRAGSFAACVFGAFLIYAAL